MENVQFEKWCREATGEIRFTPDRRAVYDELMAHLEDHRDSMLEQGCSQKEAEAKALEAMGKAWEVAPMLAQVHPPFWGYAYRVTKVVAILLCCLALLHSVLYWGGTGLNYLQNADTTAILLKNPPDPVGWEAVTVVHPKAVVYQDSYWIRLPDAVLWKYGGVYRLSLHLQTCTLLPNMGFMAFNHFWAIDDQGNHYNSWAEGHNMADPCVWLGGGYASSGYQSIDMEIRGIPSAEIQWVELHYDRDGRDIVFRIDLTGGETS